MNETDHSLIFDQIFSILNNNISTWSVIEVEQFLQLVNCGPFQKIIRFFGVNGQMLLEPNKIQALITPQLKPSTTLLYEKLMFVLEELKPTQYRQSNVKQQRHSRDTLSINGKLMKSIKNAKDFVKEKNMVLWTTEDIVVFLNAGGMGRFTEMIEKTCCDGILMLYVIPDRRKMLRMSKFFQGRQLQEIVYVSQILLAQYFMQNNEDNELQDIQQIQLTPKEHSQIIFNMKRVQSFQSLNECSQDYMIVQSMESAYQQNDFIMTEDADNASILQTNQITEKEQDRWEQITKQVSAQTQEQEKQIISKYHPRQSNRFDNDDGVRESYQSLAVSEYPEDLNNLAQSQYPESQYMAGSRMSRPQQSQLAESIIGSPNNHNTSNQLDQSQYNQLDQSQYHHPLALSKNELAQSEYNQLAESQYNNLTCSELPDNNNVLQQLAYASKQKAHMINNILSEMNSSPSTSKQTNEAIEKYRAQFQKIKNVTLTMPFNLMNFKYLNQIVLGQVKKSNKKNQIPDQNDAIGDRQTFGIQGCKFGRDGSNDYSYPDQSSISHKHAMIFFKDKNFYLQDLASKTGTYIQIDQIQIYDGLVIQLAFQVQITFQIIMKYQQGAIKVIFKLPSNMPNYQAIIPNKMNCRIGRSKNSKILIDSNNVSVSQKHAQIVYEDQKFWFKDLGSQNGSWQRLSDKGVVSELYPLSVGDNIRISTKKRLRVMSIEIKDFY